jgi:CheY-like chemotaxis protein
MRKRILVVDDDPLYLDLVRDLFSAHEIDVSIAADGAAALTILETEQPALIISDVDMPGMNGVELHSHLLKNRRIGIIPFVFMSGAADERLFSYARKNGLRLLNKGNLIGDLLQLSDDLQ